MCKKFYSYRIKVAYLTKKKSSNKVTKNYKQNSLGDVYCSLHIYILQSEHVVIDTIFLLYKFYCTFEIQLIKQLFLKNIPDKNFAYRFFEIHL